MAACTSSGEEVEVRPVDDQGPLHPLAEAAGQPWVQRVWFEAAPGERVEGVTTVVGREARLVVGLVDGEGRRRAVMVDGPGVIGTLPHRVPELSRSTTSDNGPDGHTRAQVERRGTLTTLRLVDTMGAPPRDLVRDRSGVILRHPSFSADGQAVYVDEASGLGGIWRVALADGSVTRVVPEIVVATPIGVRLGDGGEGVAYIEELAGQPPRLMVATPPQGPVRPVDSSVEPAWWPLVTTAGGERLRLEGCQPGPWLRVEGALIAGATLAVAGAVPCGEGCTALVQQTPAGAMRVVGELRRGADGARWWLDPALDAPAVDLWVAGASAEALPALKVCAPPLSDAPWLQEVRYAAGPRGTFGGIEKGADRLLVHGTRNGGKQPFVGIVPFSGESVRTQTTSKPVVVDAMSAEAPERGWTVSIREGKLLWNVNGQPEVTLIGADPALRLTGVSFGPGQAYVLVSDQGAKPGLWKVGFKGEKTRLVDATAPWSPVSFEQDGQTWLGWLDEVDGQGLLVVARAMAPNEEAAWSDGLATVLPVRPAWSAVQRVDGQPQRCTGWEASLKRAGDTMELQVGPVRRVVQAAVVEADGAVSFLAGEGSAIWRVFQARPDRDAPVVGATAGMRFVEGLGTADLPDAPSWFPTEEVSSLPQGGPCREHG